MDYIIKEPYKSDYQSIVDGLYNGKDSLVSSLWKNILLEFYDWNIFASYPDDVETNLTKWIEQFTRVLDETYPRYKVLFDAYESERDNLLARLKSISNSSSKNKNERRYNDTPQVPDDGTLPTDKYLTDFTKTDDHGKAKTTTEYDPTTIMQRLNELDSLYRDHLREWTNEFRFLFYPPEVEL